MLCSRSAQADNASRDELADSLASQNSHSSEESETFEEELLDSFPNILVRPPLLHQATLLLPDSMHQLQSWRRRKTSSTMSFAFSIPTAVSATCEKCHDRGFFTKDDVFVDCRRDDHPPVVLLGRYELTAPLGQGAFSVVWAAHDRFHPTRHVALKIMNASAWTVAADELHILECLRRGRSISSPSKNKSKSAFHAERESEVARWASSVLVRFYGYFQAGSHIVFVMERLMSVPQQTLAASVATRHALIQLLRRLALALVLTVAHLNVHHDSLHADIKWDNVLFSEQDAVFKLVDFGNVVPCGELSRYYSDFELQSLAYRAPEVLAGSLQGVNVRIDSWSIGCVLAEAVLGRPLFLPEDLTAQTNGDREEIYRRVMEAIQLLFGSCDSLFGDCRFPHRLHSTLVLDPPLSRTARAVVLGQILRVSDRDLVDFMAALLDPSPRSRMSALDALQHPFLLPLQPTLFLVRQG